MSPSLRRLLGSLAIGLFIYVGLSGPLAGLTCYGERRDPAHHEFWAELYERHRQVYFPLFELAGWVGCRHTLMTYWTFWGWEYQE